MESVFLAPAVSLVAERQGIFSAQDVLISRTFVASSHAQLDDLVEGRADVAVTATDNLFTWNRSGADLALIGQVESTTDLVLLLRSDVSDLDDLSALRLAVDAPTNGFAVVAYAMLEQLGRPASSYDVIEVGGVTERFEALRQGTADVTLVAAPLDETGVSSGMTALMRVGDLVPSYPGLGIVARRSTVASSRSSWRPISWPCRAPWTGCARRRTPPSSRRSHPRGSAPPQCARSWLRCP